MPELPEVETVRRSLLPHVKGKTIKQVKALHPKLTKGDAKWPGKLKGKKVTDIGRRGKLLYFELDKGKLFMTCHLKMTGQLLYAKKKAKAGGGHTLTESDLELPNQHTRVAIEFTDGSTLYFNDMRLFGYVRTVLPPELDEILKTYGIEPGMDNFTLEAFKDALKKRNTNVKALLLNQGVVSGLGNIYVDEACHYARVRPTRNVKRLTSKEKEQLFEGCNHVINRAIEAGGTTFYSFMDTEAKPGNYLDSLAVFAKQGQPCPSCKNGTIKKIKHAGRGTHYCPECQK